MEQNVTRGERDQVGRRAFLGGVALSSLPLDAAPTGTRSPAPIELETKTDASFPGIISRQRNPDNFEFPFPTLNSFITPNEQFYVRTHFEVPELDAKTWRLKVDGAVEHPTEISFDQLRQMPTGNVTALLECSGNSRVFLEPPQVSIRWEQGAVSNAEWSGVPLSAVLDKAGVKEGTVEVVFEGADKGSFSPPEPKTPGEITYARSLPLNVAKRPEVLLAYKMNGHELPPDHGFPVRLIVPAHYGMASVKWIKRIIVTDQPFHGFFQTFMYSVWERRNGLPHLVPVSQIQVKAQIARPMSNEVVRANSPYRIFGAAWTGCGQVAKVEVTTDGGEHWADARLLGTPVAFSWRLWVYSWDTPPYAGPRTIMARATDDQGNVQPLDRDDDRRDAMINHVQPIKVQVR